MRQKEVGTNLHILKLLHLFFELLNVAFFALAKCTLWNVSYCQPAIDMFTRT